MYKSILAIVLSAILLPSPAQYNEVTFWIETNSGREIFYVPRSYLSSYRNWEAGSTNAVSVDIFFDLSRDTWNSDDQTDRKPTANAVPLYVRFSNQGSFGTRVVWDKIVSPNLEPFGPAAGDLMAFRRVLPKTLAKNVATVFLPQDAEQATKRDRFVFLECGVNSRETILNCAVDTDFSEFIHVKYIFDGKHLEKWRSIDSFVHSFITALKSPH